MTRSQETVEKILRKFPYAVNERNSLGQTPLHLSADWLWGTIRLLAAGARVDIPDEQGIYPVYYASALMCSATLEVLLASDSPISVPWAFHQNRLGLFGFRYEPLPVNIFEQLCDALADRRRRLVTLAKQVLPTVECTKLFGSSTGILDSRAWEVCNAIANTGIRIPSALQVPAGGFTVYHTGRLTTQNMQRLYDIGFRDVDTRDSLGETPLVVAARYMYREGAEVCEWLISKGADPLKEVTDFGTVQIHHLASAMANLAMGKIQRLHLHRKRRALSGKSFASLRSGIKLISENSNLMVKDYCRCACSPDGCSPLTVFLKNAIGQIYEESLDPLEGDQGCSRCHHQERLLPETCGILEYCVQKCRESIYFLAIYALDVIYEQQEIPDSAFMEVVRLFLFMELELTHTCCAAYSYLRIGRPKSWEETREILDEERELLLDLEELCLEASTKRMFYDGQFNEFLQEFLLEVRERSRSGIDDEGIRRIEEIGVVLDYGTLGR